MEWICTKRVMCGDALLSLCLVCVHVCVPVSVRHNVGVFGGSGGGIKRTHERTHGEPSDFHTSEWEYLCVCVLKKHTCIPPPDIHMHGIICCELTHVRVAALLLCVCACESGCATAAAAAAAAAVAVVAAH